MKLKIKKNYFDLIKSGIKDIDYRDAHITFVCEETGETLVKYIRDIKLVQREEGLYSDVLSDKWIVRFSLSDLKG